VRSTSINLRWVEWLMKHYGITQQNLKSTRKAMKVALMCVNQSPEDMNAWHGYYMAQLAQTYRTRKVMYANPVHT
jgi:phosphoserine phosphatase